MQLIQTYARIISSASILIFLSGCAGIAYRAYSCDDQMPMAKLVGNIFQLGDCSISKSFHFESGDYYKKHKDKIDYEISEYNLASIGTRDALTDFARSYNCDKEVLRHFSDQLFINKEKVFGEVSSNWSRAVSLNIIEMIKEDEVLSKHCMQ